MAKLEGWMAKLERLMAKLSARFEPRHPSKIIIGDISNGVANALKPDKKMYKTTKTKNFVNNITDI